MARTATNGTKTADAADIAAQLEAVKADLSALTATVSDYATGKAGAAKERVTTDARAAGEAARARAELTAEQTTQLVRDNPGAALGIAAGVGFLVGFLSSRR